MVALSISRMCRNRVATFSVVACCALLRTSSFLSHPSLHGSGREVCSLVHIEFCVKTFHLGTVSVCLAWSSLLPRYCCCVDCLNCDLDICYFTISYLKLDTGDQRDLKYRGFPYPAPPSPPLSSPPPSAMRGPNSVRPNIEPERRPASGLG